MDLSDIAENTSHGKIVSALVTIILAGFLWVGKTTFEHVGQVAGLRHEIEAAQQDRNLLRRQYDDIVSMLNERTKSRFTREDADKVVDQIKEVDKALGTLKDTFLRDYNSLKIEIAAVATDARHNTTYATHTPTVIGAGRLPPVQQGVHQGSETATQQIKRLEFQIASLQGALANLQRQVTQAYAAGSSNGQAQTMVAQPHPGQLPTQRR